MSSEYFTNVNGSETIIGRRRAGNGNKMFFEFMPIFKLDDRSFEISVISPDGMIKYYSETLSPDTEIIIDNVGITTWHDLKDQLTNGELELSEDYTGSRKIYSK